MDTQPQITPHTSLKITYIILRLATGWPSSLLQKNLGNLHFKPHYPCISFICWKNYKVDRSGDRCRTLDEPSIRNVSSTSTPRIGRFIRSEKSSNESSELYLSTGSPGTLLGNKYWHNRSQWNLCPHLCHQRILTKGFWVTLTFQPIFNRENVVLF
jgi:hypothetical protein